MFFNDLHPWSFLSDVFARLSYNDILTFFSISQLCSKGEILVRFKLAVVAFTCIQKLKIPKLCKKETDTLVRKLSGGNSELGGKFTGEDSSAIFFRDSANFLFCFQYFIWSSCVWKFPMCFNFHGSFYCTHW